MLGKYYNTTVKISDDSADYGVCVPVFQYLRVSGPGQEKAYAEEADDTDVLDPCAGIRVNVSGNG